METVDVLLTPNGAPWKVRRNGVIWQVVLEPFYYFDRVRWWEEPSFNIKKGQSDRIDYAVWTIQVQVSGKPWSEVMSWELVENPRLKSWVVRDLPGEVAA